MFARSVDAGIGEGSLGATNLREGTLGEDTVVALVRPDSDHWMMYTIDLHEQTGLAAGTVTDNDQLATDLGHLRDSQWAVSRGCECARARVMRLAEVVWM